MAKIKVHAGDFLKGEQNSFTHMLGQGSFTLLTKEHRVMGETISVTQVEDIDLASEDSVKRMGGTIGWGLGGAAVFGPVGLLAGLVLGGKAKEITFVCKFKDGRKLMGTVDAKDYQKIQASLMDAPKQAQMEAAMKENQRRSAEKKSQKAVEKALAKQQPSKPDSQATRIAKIVLLTGFGLFMLMAIAVLVAL